MKQRILTASLALGLASFVLLERSDGAPVASYPAGSRPATAEELALLRRLSLVRVPHGTDPTHPGFATLRLTGVDLQLVSGLGATNGDPLDPAATSGTTNGSGNLLIGYGDAGTGSHNVVLGSQVADGVFGALAAGQANQVQASHAAALAGRGSVVSAPGAVVAGGELGLASGTDAAVTGGSENEALGDASVVLGGRQGLALGLRSVITGGLRGQTGILADDGCLSGGQDGSVVGRMAAIAGGFSGDAWGETSFVGGGNGGLATQGASVVLGGYRNGVAADWGVVVGGNTNTVDGDLGVVIGGLDNVAGGLECVVSGGRLNRSGSCDWDYCDQYNSVQGGYGNRAVYNALNDWNLYQSIGGGQDRSMNGFCTGAAFGSRNIWRAGGMFRCQIVP